jgi:hypothetical protein
MTFGDELLAGEHNRVSRDAQLAREPPRRWQPVPGNKFATDDCVEKLLANLVLQADGCLRIYTHDEEGHLGSSGRRFIAKLKQIVSRSLMQDNTPIGRPTPIEPPMPRRHGFKGFRRMDAKAAFGDYRSR